MSEKLPPHKWRMRTEQEDVPTEPPSPEEVATWKQKRNKVIVFREVELPPNRLYPWAELEVGESFWAPDHICSTQQFGARVVHGASVAKRINGRPSRFTLTGRGMGGRVLVTRVE